VSEPGELAAATAASPFATTASSAANCGVSPMTRPVISRRTFLQAGTAVATAAALGAAAPRQRKQIAFIGTVVRTHSHPQHFLDRLAMGYTWEGGWHTPEVDIASVYIDQFPERDLARERVKKYNLKLYSTIREALTLGGPSLAVDGVVIIAEHGRYPRNELRQTLYPRYKFFKEIIGVFEQSGRSVPIFNDKHLSTTWAECAEMVADSKRLEFPFLAGSSLPVTRRLPAVELPHGTPLAESVCAGYGGIDSYDFHGLETAQCMSERRRGGEVGIKGVQALRGPTVWDRLSSRPKTQKLLVAALTRSHTLPVVEGYPSAPISLEWVRAAMPDPIAYFIEHRDGFHTTLFLLPIQDFNYAGMNSETGEIISCQMYLPMPTRGATTADFFNPLCHHIEGLVLQGRAAYPVERTLLTSGMVIAGVQSLHQGGALVETPEMEVRYSVPDESHFWKD
jgi:hypothetical protein